VTATEEAEAMFLAAYHFEGDPGDLARKYDVMREAFADDDLILHVCVVGDNGMTIYDACPDRATFEAFSTGAPFTAELERSGLPSPRIEPLGEVHAAVKTS
jgi:hypothetical protein